MRISLIVITIVLAVAPVYAETQCSCAAALFTGNPNPVFDQASINWGYVATYPSGPFTNVDQNRIDCEQKCILRASSDPNFQNHAWWCSRINKAYDGRVAVWVRLDPAQWHVPANPTSNYPLRCCIVPPAGPACTAPFALVANSPDPKRCAKPSGEITSPPYPPDRTLIGQWGFTLGKTIYQWGPPAQQQQQAAQIKACP